MKKQLFYVSIVLFSILSNISAAQIPYNIPTDGLIAWYPFNGNANDESGNGYDGIVNNALLTKDRYGNDNSAYSFTTDQDILVPRTEKLNLYPLTISLWYNIDSLHLGENVNIFSKYYPAQWNGYIIHLIKNEEGTYTYPWYIRNTDNRVLGLYGEEPFYQSDVKTNYWYNFTFVVDESGGKIYVDGKLVDSDVWTGTAGAISNDNLFKIGGLYNHWFHGKIDDIAIWNRALSSVEIEQFYQFNFTDAPVANSIQRFCSNSTLLDIEIDGSNIKWYSQPTGGSPLNSSTPLKNGVTYYASQTINGIESYRRIGIRVIIPEFNIVADKNNIYSGENVNLSVELGDNKIEYKIGSIGPAGGYVFYDKGNNNDGWQFMEVTPIDVAYNSGLGCYCHEIEGTSAAIGTGLTNTQSWLSSGCDGYWLMLANNYKLNGYSEWFIPSKDELNELYANLKLKNFGSLSDAVYWSSTPASYGSCGINGGVWVQSFKTGDVFSDYRNGYQGAGNLRLARYFSDESDDVKYLWSSGETSPNINVNPKSTTNYWVDVTINGITCRKNITIAVEEFQMPSNIPTDGLIGWYPFNGNANDESGNELHGTVNNAVLTNDRFGNVNAAYSFTENQDIVVPNTEDHNFYPLTISLWYNIDSIYGCELDNGNIFSKYSPAVWNGYQIVTSLNQDFGSTVQSWYILNRENRVLGLYGEPPFQQSNVSFDRWYHYVFVLDETGGKIYVNGEMTSTDEWTGNAGACTNGFLWKIGGLYDCWFHGKIDDIGIWNRALSQDEILLLFDGSQSTYLEITCPYDITVSCSGDVPPPDISAINNSGNCENITVKHISDVSDGATCPEIIIRTYEASDDCGNIVSCAQKIIVVDTISPIIECPPDVTVACENDIPFPASNLYEFENTGGIVADKCGIETIEWVEDVALMIYPLTSIARTYLVTDRCGNTEFCSQAINIRDTIPPTFTVPADAYILKDENCEYNASVEITGDVVDAFDNCSNFMDANFDDELVTDSFGNEVINRTWTVIDGFFNTEDKVQKIYIEDITPPSILCPPDVIIESEVDIPEPFSSLIDFSLYGGEYEDNCGIVEESFSLYHEFLDSLVSPIELKRTYIIADTYGNESVCLHKIKIENFTSSLEINASNKFDFFVYPNPTSNKLFINSNIRGEIVIINLLGDVIHRQLINEQKEEIDVSGMVSGTYLIRFNDNVSHKGVSFIKK